MATIIIRNLPSKTVAGLEELAKQHGESREEYVRKLLNHHVMYVEVEGLHKRYDELVRQVTENMTLVVTENTRVLNAFIELNGGEKA